MYSEKSIDIDRIQRWRLTGKITLLSALHIGDGGEATLADRSGRNEEGSYATVFANHQGTPVLPASSVKGSLRAWAVARGMDDALINTIFGHQGQGSAITIHDAILTQHAPVTEEEKKNSHWNDKRGTVLVPHVVIDPRTRTAADKLLYYVESVPAGSVFTLEVTGQGVSEDSRRAFVYILENAFTSTTRPARLGSEAANSWGQVRWDTSSVEVLDIAKWLERQPARWTESLTPLEPESLRKWLAPPASAPVQPPAGQSIRLDLTLRFDGPMLINDPTRERRGNANGQGAVGKAVIRRVDGKAYLPASSVRGSFRAQARRIWQTLAWDNSADLNREGLVTTAPHNGKQRELAPFLKMFGATGWRSPLEISDFELDGKEKIHIQEFVAIDRFTGSVAGEKKFNAHALLRPIFRGTICIRPDRWGNAEANEWTWLVFLWALRDWAEGDGCIGSGSAKGYGRFRAEIQIEGGDPAGLISGVLRRDPVALKDQRLEQWETSLLKEIGKA